MLRTRVMVVGLWCHIFWLQYMEESGADNVKQYSVSSFDCFWLCFSISEQFSIPEWLSWFSLKHLSYLFVRITFFFFFFCGIFLFLEKEHWDFSISIVSYKKTRMISGYWQIGRVIDYFIDTFKMVILMYKYIS